MCTILKIIQLIWFLAYASLFCADYSTGILAIKIGDSPSNEAVIIDDQGFAGLFFVNRPGNADGIMSMDWTDENWTNPSAEFTIPGKSYDALQLAESQTGDLICVSPVFGTGKNGYRDKHLDLWVNHRIDGKWGIPFKIYVGYVGAICGMKRLSSGRLLLAFARAIPEREKSHQEGNIDYGWNTIISMYSDDNGHSWKLSHNEIKIAIERTKPTRHGAIEPDIIELEKGTIWMLIRMTSGFLYKSKSSDGGESWEDPVPTS